MPSPTKILPEVLSGILNNVPIDISALKVAVPLIVGLASVLFVRVSVVVLPTSVSVVAGKVKVTFPENAECAGAFISA